MDSEEVVFRLNQAELHLRNIRTELNEAGRSLDGIRRAF